jgi:hypothetical protein
LWKTIFKIRIIVFKQTRLKVGQMDRLRDRRVLA